MKKFLIVANILALVIFIFLTSYGIWIVMPQVSEKAIANSQKHIIIMSNLYDIPDRMIDSDGYKPVTVYGISDQPVVDQPQSPTTPVAQEKQKEEKKDKEQVVLSESDHKIRISLVITGLGNNFDALKKVELFPKEVSFGYSPYCPDLTDHMNAIIAKGHEIYVQIPFEPQNYPIDDPGPLGILRSQHNKENPNRLNAVLTKFPSIQGVYSDPGEKFTYYKEEMGPILDLIHEQKVPFLYGNGSGNKVFDDLAKEKAIQIAYKDLLIDQEINEASIKAKLAQIEEIAIKNGSALAYARPYPITLSIISEWILSLDNKGIALISASQIAK